MAPNAQVMALRYFNTFIDEEPEQVEASTGRLHRSKSWPQRCRSSGDDFFLFL
jgi:hypothetical protein